MKFQSKFGGLWIDQSDFQDVLHKKIETSSITKKDANLISDIATKGYAIIPQAVSHQEIDVFNEEIAQFDQRADYLIGRDNQGYQTPNAEQVANGKTRLIDVHANSAKARKLIFNDVSSRFLNQYLEGTAIAFQTLLFIYGSQQALHQDPAYVVVNNPMDLVASWLALEDIEEGTGELIYLESSHRADDYLFSEEYKHWKPSRDGREQHQQFLGRLVDFQESGKYETKRFLAKKGDILFWHADLAHGGSKVTKPGKTRKSLVTHFCSSRSLPNFASYAPNLYHPVEDVSGHLWCSRHYNLKAEEYKIADETLSPAFKGHKFTANEVTFFASHLIERSESRTGTSITLDGDEMVIESDTNDPGFFLDLDLVSPTETYEIVVDMSSVEAGTAQLFFKKIDQETFTQPCSKNLEYDAGRTQLMFMIGQVMQKSKLRFDPSHLAGTFCIHSLRCKWIV